MTQLVKTVVSDYLVRMVDMALTYAQTQSTRFWLLPANMIVRHYHIPPGSDGSEHSIASRICTVSRLQVESLRRYFQNSVVFVI